MKRLILALVMVSGLFFAYVGLAQAPTALSATGGPGTHICTNPGNNVSSSPSAEFGFGGASVVSADVWNDINISQTLSACAMNSWKVSASAAESGDNGAVQSYPDSNVTIPATALSSYTTLTSNFRITDPPSCAGNDYESAYDIWIGGSAEWSNTPQRTELMIWSDVCNQQPAGAEQPGTVTLDGHAYTVWIGGALGGSNGDIVTYKAVSDYESGHMDLLDFTDNAASNSWLTTNPFLWQVGSGFEVCFTDGTQTFQQTAFNLWGNGLKIIG